MFFKWQCHKAPASKRRLNGCMSLELYSSWCQTAFKKYWSKNEIIIALRPTCSVVIFRPSHAAFGPLPPLERFRCIAHIARSAVTKLKFRSRALHLISVTARFGAFTQDWRRCGLRCRRRRGPRCGGKRGPWREPWRWTWRGPWRWIYSIGVPPTLFIFLCSAFSMKAIAFAAEMKAFIISMLGSGDISCNATKVLVAH